METFSLLKYKKYKKSGICPDFLCICAANAVLCTLSCVFSDTRQKDLFGKLCTAGRLTCGALSCYGMNMKTCLKIVQVAYYFFSCLVG